MQADRPAVIVAGATGLVGRELVRRLLQDKHTGTVHALVRKTAAAQPDARRLQTHVVNVNAPGPLPVAHECYIALGTTIKAAGSQAAFRAIDRDAVIAVAQAARASGVTRLAFVSALGADEQSSVFYNRVKGEAEAALASLNFDRLVIARPSLLVGNRHELGQPPRRLESLATNLLKPISPWISPRWRPIEASVLAKAMVKALRADGPNVHVLESWALLSMGS